MSEETKPIVPTDPIELSQREAMLDALIASKMAGLEDRLGSRLSDFLERVGKAGLLPAAPITDTTWLVAGLADYDKACAVCGHRMTVWYQRTGAHRQACGNKACTEFNAPEQVLIP